MQQQLVEVRHRERRRDTVARQIEQVDSRQVGVGGSEARFEDPLDVVLGRDDRHAPGLASARLARKRLAGRDAGEQVDHHQRLAYPGVAFSERHEPLRKPKLPEVYDGPLDDVALQVPASADDAHSHEKSRDAYVLEVSGAQDFPNAARFTAQGFVQVLLEHMGGKPVRVSSRRPGPDRLLYAISQHG